MSRRVTTEILASGQASNYADHVYRVRVTFEIQMPSLASNEADTWMPDPLYRVVGKAACGAELRDLCAEQHVRKALRGLLIGFTDMTRKDPNWEWHKTELEYLREIAPAVWEFQTRSAYTG